MRLVHPSCVRALADEDDDGRPCTLMYPILRARCFVCSECLRAVFQSKALARSCVFVRSRRRYACVDNQVPLHMTTDDPSQAPQPLTLEWVLPFPGCIFVTLCSGIQALMYLTPSQKCA